MIFRWDTPPYNSGGASILDTDFGRFMVKRIRPKAHTFEVYLNGTLWLRKGVRGHTHGTREECQAVVENFLSTREGEKT